ncbi:MAG: hypothetical protein IJ333_01920 [Clostridia bacterium]|nr:hypothetical protein [Clostridia bacterium]
MDLHEPYSYDGGSRAYDLSADQTTVQIGDTVNLTVRDGTNHELVNSGSTVYTVVSGGIVSNHHSISARLALTFKKEYAPDICVYGAYFDGKHVYSLGYEYLNYDQSNAEVQIQMEKDQLQYRPGDEVTLTFHVTDPEGKPVETALNISVMDRALHLIGGGNLETPAEGFFRSRCFSTPVYITCSHREFGMGTVIGGGGGGDGDPLRSDFEDTPFFKTVATDKNGKATVTFTLPDTITEWKVLARAISPELLVGNETFELVSTQDYFAGVSMAETLKADDEVTIGVKGDGRKALADAICNFTVGITDRNGNEIQTLTAAAPKSQYAYLNFGQLEAGVYTAYIQTSCGELEDSVIRSFTVEDSQSTVWIHHQQEVAGSVSLSLIPQKGNVTLTIVDEQKAFWQKAMARLRAGGGERVDQVLGQYLADQYYADGIWMNPETLDHAAILSYMNYDGVKLLPASNSSDLKLSAKLAAVAPAFCDQEILRDAFEQYLNNRYAARVDVMTAYFGLAALGEPVLADLQAFCLSVSDFTAEEYAYLALGLAYCGDYDTAAYLYETHLKSLLAEENGMIYAEEEDLTGCCALLANRLNLPASEGLMQYILETDTETTLLHLELISYLNDHAVDTVGENTVTVSLGDGSNQTYTYSKTGQLVLLLNEKQAENIRIMNGSGNSYVSYAYRGTPDALAQLGEALPLAGTEIPAAVARGETAIIQLHVELPADFEGATLDCTLPAGLRLESGTVTCGNMEYGIYSPYHSRVISTALPEGSCVITLEVRGALPGNYMLEPITVTHAGDHRYMATSPAVVSVVS